MYSQPMAQGPHEFVNKTVTVNLWGMDNNLKPFTSTAQTRRLAEGAVEVEFDRQLAVGEVVGLGFQGKRSRFRVLQCFLAGAAAFRVTMEDVGSACMWKSEMATPDVIVPRGERRRDARVPVIGGAVLFNASGISTNAKLCDISRRGCYVEVYSPAPVGTQMRVLLTLEGNLQVDITAEVRTCHPTIGMGLEIVRFAAPEDEDRLQRVLQALEQPQNA